MNKPVYRKTVERDNSYHKVTSPDTMISVKVNPRGNYSIHAYKNGSVYVANVLDDENTVESTEKEFDEHLGMAMDVLGKILIEQ